jgi:hypothetical protein
MFNEAIKAVEEYRSILNKDKVQEVNKWISEDFIGYFGYYNDKDYEIYDAKTYKKSNLETINSYQDKSPYWEYNDLTKNLRSETEIILSSIINFYLSGEKVASALAMEIFRKEKDGWKLYRQHMERYSS